MPALEVTGEPDRFDGMAGSAWRRREARQLRLSDGQALTAFGAPCVQHFAPTFGRHAGTEPVCAFPLQVTRLKGSFHDVAARWCSEGPAILGSPLVGVK